MLEQRGCRIWRKLSKSYYKLAKKGRVLHVVASLTTCLALTAPAFSADVINSQPIQVSGANVSGLSTGYNQLSANDRVENTAQGSISVTSTSGQAVGINIDSLGDTNAVVNNGEITVTQNHDGSATGISATYIIPGTTEISNSGIISITKSGSGNVHGIHAVQSRYEAEDPYAETSDTLTNRGTISITSSGTGRGYGIYLADESSEPVSTTIMNIGTIEALDTNGNTVSNLYAVHSSGNVVNSAGATLRGRLRTADLDNAGAIHLPTDRSNVDGDFIQRSTGVLGVAVSNDADPNNPEYSQLTVSGQATFEAGSTVDVDVRSTPPNQRLLAGQTLEGVVQSAGGLTVDPETLQVKDNSILLDFTASKSESDGKDFLNLTAEQAVTIHEAAQDSDTPVAIGAAQALDSLVDSPDPEVITFISNLNRLGTSQEVAEAVAKTAPVVASQAPAVATQVSNTMSSVVQSRQQTVHGMSSGDAMAVDQDVWVKVFGGRMDQDDVDGVNGFTASTYGFGVGMDNEYVMGKHIGLALLYTKATVETHHVDQENNLDIFNFMLYGSRPVLDPATTLFYQVGGGFQFNGASRAVNTTRATADYTAKNLFFQVKASRNYTLGDALTAALGPVVNYSFLQTPSYTETGAGGLNLNVEKFDSSNLIASVEGDLTWAVAEGTELNATLSLGYDVINENSTVNSSFQGSNVIFSTEGIDASPVVYTAGLGLAKQLTQDLTLDARYDFEGRGNDFRNHAVSARLTLDF